MEPTTYTATYHNGKTAWGCAANVTIKPDHLLIQTTDAEEMPLQLQWQTAAITRYKIGKDGSVSLQYGTFPVQTLRVNAAGFAATLKQHYPQAPFLKPAFKRALNSDNQFLVWGGLGIVGLALLLYIVAIPYGSDWLARIVPQSYEATLGESIYNNYMEGQKTDPAKTAAANHFMRHLKPKSSYPIEVTVVNSSQMNAFALPGGHIVVYSAILDSIKNYEAFAALLAHERSHVELRHATRSVFRSLGGYFAISVVLGDLSGISAVILANADKLKNLSYSRDFETEADVAGLAILQANNVNPQGMVDLFEILKKVEVSGQTVPTLLSTHPGLDERIQHTKQTLHNNRYSIAFNDSLAYYWSVIKQ